MIIKRLRALEIIGFSSLRFLSLRPKGFVNRYELFRSQVTRNFGTVCGVCSLLLTNHAISHFDGLAAIRRLRIEHANIIAIITVLHFFPFHWDVQFFLGHGLKGIGLCQRYPDTGFAFNLWKFNSIDELELIGAFDDAWTVSSASRNRVRQEKYREYQ